jgi:hypothetical protein
MLQQLLAQLSPTINTDHETTPRDQREKSAKLPKKSSFRANNTKRIQVDNPSEKNLAPNRPMPTLANRNSELRTQDSELLSCRGRENDAPPANIKTKTPSTVNDSCSPQEPHIQTSAREPANVKKPKVSEPGPLHYRLPSEMPQETPSENRKLETENCLSMPPGLTPEMRAQIFTPLFPKGNGARDPEIIPAPANKPPENPPPKKGIFSTLIHLFQKNKESFHEDNLISPPAGKTGRKSEVPFHLNEIYEGYQKDIQEGIIVPGAFNRLLDDIHPPGPGHLEGGL